MICKWSHATRIWKKYTLPTPCLRHWMYICMIYDFIFGWLPGIRKLLSVHAYDGYYLGVVFLPHQGESVNDAACKLALQASSESEDGILVAGSVTKTEAYTNDEGKEKVQQEFRRQLDFYIRNDLDFVVAEVCKNAGKASPTCRYFQQCWYSTGLLYTD